MEENNKFDNKSLKKVTGRTADFDELSKDCVAFANSHGGYLAIGLVSHNIILTRGMGKGVELFALTHKLSFGHDKTASPARPEAFVVYAPVGLFGKGRRCGPNYYLTLGHIFDLDRSGKVAGVAGENLAGGS